MIYILVIVAAAYALGIILAYTEKVEEINVTCPKCGRCVPCGRCHC